MTARTVSVFFAFFIIQMACANHRLPEAGGCSAAPALVLSATLAHVPEDFAADGGGADVGSVDIGGADGGRAGDGRAQAPAGSVGAGRSAGQGCVAGGGGSGVAATVAEAHGAGGVSLQFGLGIGEQYQRTGLSYETPSLWGMELGMLGRIDLSLETGAAYWSNTGGGTGNDELFQFTVLPLLRWRVLDRFFLEGGVGPSVFSNRHFVGKDISTHFQFADHIGGGVCLSESLCLSVRYAHFSNGGIRRPNPGLNVIMVSLLYFF